MIVKISISDLTLSSSLEIKPPGISEALIRFEVILEKNDTLNNMKAN